MAAVAIYRAPVRPEWIDYNGHLRDAYYGLIVSHAADALMDRLRMDASYRERSGCTLYTVEMHVHFLHEVHRSETVAVAVQLLAADHKRIHAGFELRGSSHPALAATAELMLLHVRQGATPAAVSFPPEVAAAIAELRSATAGQAFGPRSRALSLGAGSRRA
ncbi:MAG TPA: thioesterase family protein [Steroidobacteraceae bacterium]|nr:thioesterase family protein [Steroidobacteraceae bacterium]